MNTATSSTDKRHIYLSFNRLIPRSEHFPGNYHQNKDSGLNTRNGVFYLYINKKVVISMCTLNQFQINIFTIKLLTDLFIIVSL